MKKLSLSTFISIGLITTSASAVTYTIGDVFSGISKAVSSVTAPSDGSSSSVSSSASAGVLVKDLPDLPKLADKPFLRGLSKIDYAEIQRPKGSKNCYRISSLNCSGRCIIGQLAKNYQNRSEALEFQDDAANKKPFERSNKLSTFSNPYANQSSAFDLSKLDEVTRNDDYHVYTYTINTHFKIPDEFIKNGKFVFEAQTPAVQTYNRGNVALITGSNSGFNQLCYHKINNNFLTDKKATYLVKKGNIVDYSLTCYFSGDSGSKKILPSTIQSIRESNEILPKSWTAYSVPDPLAKEAGKSYTLTNRDMFLYEYEVYPAK